MHPRKNSIRFSPQDCWCHMANKWELAHSFEADIILTTSNAFRSFTDSWFPALRTGSCDSRQPVCQGNKRDGRSMKDSCTGILSLVLTVALITRLWHISHYNLQQSRGGVRTSKLFWMSFKNTVLLFVKKQAEAFSSVKTGPRISSFFSSVVFRVVICSLQVWNRTPSRREQLKDWL